MYVMAAVRKKGIVYIQHLHIQNYKSITFDRVKHKQLTYRAHREVPSNSV